MSTVGRRPGIGHRQYRPLGTGVRDECRRLQTALSLIAGRLDGVSSVTREVGRARLITDPRTSPQSRCRSVKDAAVDELGDRADVHHQRAGCPFTGDGLLGRWSWRATRDARHGGPGRGGNLRQ